MKRFVLPLIPLLCPLAYGALHTNTPYRHSHSRALSQQQTEIAQQWVQNQLQYLSILQQITDADSAQPAIAAIEKNHEKALRVLHDALRHKDTQQILTRTDELLKPHRPAMEAELLRLKNADYFGNEKLKQLITEGAL